MISLFEQPLSISLIANVAIFLAVSYLFEVPFLSFFFKYPDLRIDGIFIVVEAFIRPNFASIRCPECQTPVFKTWVLVFFAPVNMSFACFDSVLYRQNQLGSLSREISINFLDV